MSSTTSNRTLLPSPACLDERVTQFVSCGDKSADWFSPHTTFSELVYSLSRSLFGPSTSSLAFDIEMALSSTCVKLFSESCNTSTAAAISSSCRFSFLSFPFASSWEEFCSCIPSDSK